MVAKTQFNQELVTFGFFHSQLFVNQLLLLAQSTQHNWGFIDLKLHTLNFKYGEEILN